MALPKIEEARQLDDQALEDAIVATKRRLFELRFQKATRQLEKGDHQFKHERHRLAQLMTVQRERALSAVVSESSQAPVEASPSQTATTSVAEEE